MTRNERATLMSPLSMPKQVLKATKWSAKPTRLSFKTIGMFYLLNVIILWPLSYLMSHFVGLGVSVRILPFLVLILVILEYLATVSIKETKGGAEEDAEEAEGWVWFKRALVKAFDSRKLISIKRAFPPQKLSVGNSGGVAKNSHHSKNDFSKMDLRDKIFKRKDLRKAIFFKALLCGADFQEAKLVEANFSEADLHGCNFERAYLQKANLTKAKLQGARLKMANFEGACMIQVSLRDADLLKAVLREADLEDAILMGAILLEANLQGANLQKANLLFANLLFADLKEANLRGADLRGARNLTVEQLLGAKVYNTTKLDPDLRRQWIRQVQSNKPGRYSHA